MIATTSPATTPPTSIINKANTTSSTSVINTLPYAVRATKKGGVPCVVEKRQHHRVVVVSNISGDASALLSALQRSLGTGGVLRRDKDGDSIEIQGEHHLDNVRTFLLKSGSVVGASKAETQQALTAKQKKGKGGTNNASIKSTTSTSTTQPAKETASAAEPALTPKAIKSMKPTELKLHLSKRQLSTQGNKKELTARLLDSIQST